MTTEEMEDLQDAAFRLLAKAQDLQRAGEFAGEWTDVYDRIALLLKMPTVTQYECPHCGEWAIRLHNRDGSTEEV